MQIPHYYEDLTTLHVGTEDNRAYYIPASRPMGPLVEDRERSDRFQLLNGQWKFRYCASIYDLDEVFYEAGFDPAHWDTIPVPSVWQNHGYDRHQYTNIRYPFPLDPPYVPRENPCGAYLHEFVYEPDTAAPKVFLNFEGVDSCFYVWLNGTFLGYSQVSHSTSEFDVTGTLVPGINRLAVLVLKWCDGSYMEDQDKFRTSGIFRDVYLLKRPENRIRDYFVTTKLEEASASLRLRADLVGDPAEVSVTLLDPAGTQVTAGVLQHNPEDEAYPWHGALNISDPILWNPEEPYLYTLILTTPDEVITDRVGLREISVLNNVVLLNGKPIKFHGVNRHDSDPFTGPVISLEHMKRDLLLIRQHNFNAIRTSHYPNAPMFTQLCDQYGFIVIDEADHESHGTAIATGERIKGTWHILMADNPIYTEATVDRTQRCVQRDKNRPSVVIWSLGNECAYGCCFETASAWIKSFDTSRLTHFESMHYHGEDREYDFSNLDLYSTMYPSIERLQEYVDSDPQKPYIMCEYIHAMGNGPGDAEDYFQFIQAHDIMSGGFVWEWCDHAVYKGQAPDGRAMFFYGGDHGEQPHDGNFCMDGLVYPDRRPHTGLLECKNVNRPARVVSFDQEAGMLTLHSYMDFVSLSDYLTLKFEASCDGEVYAAGAVAQLPEILPHGEGTVALSVPVPEQGKCFLKVSYFLKKATVLLPEGFFLGFDEIPLCNRNPQNQKAAALTAAAEGKLPTVAEDERYVVISTDTFCYRYDKFAGMFCSMVVGGKEFLNRPMELNIWRAPTDNDRQLKLRWFTARYHDAVTRSYTTTCSTEGNAVVLRTDVSIASKYVNKFLEATVAWSVFPDGSVNADIQAQRNMALPELPRFGLRMFLPKELENVTYYGLGPTENYIDKRRSVWHGLFTSTVAGLHEDYIRPQENGAHSDCDYVILEGNGLRFVATGDLFSFNASHYTQEELMQKAHNFELTECGSTVLCLDYRHNGIGSNSCGPALLPQYKLNEKDMHFTIRFAPQLL